MEEWRDIKRYEGIYQISNYGNGRSLDRIIEQRNRWGKFIKVKHKGKILKPDKVGEGYYKFDLCKNGVYEHSYVHQLVWETFVGKIPDGLEIDHIDTNKKNNRLDNLRLVDRGGNMRNPLTYAKYFKPCSEETKKKISKTNKGKHYSPKTEFKKGCVSAFKGKKHTEETKKILSKAHNKKVYQYTLNNILVNSYNSCKEAAEKCGYKLAGISSSATGRIPHYKGYKWSYKQHQMSEGSAE